MFTTTRGGLISAFGRLADSWHCFTNSVTWEGDALYPQQPPELTTISVSASCGWCRRTKSRLCPCLQWSAERQATGCVTVKATCSDAVQKIWLTECDVPRYRSPPPSSLYRINAGEQLMCVSACVGSLCAERGCSHADWWWQIMGGVQELSPTSDVNCHTVIAWHGLSDRRRLLLLFNHLVVGSPLRTVFNGGKLFLAQLCINPVHQSITTRLFVSRSEWSMH